MSIYNDRERGRGEEENEASGFQIYIITTSHLSANDRDLVISIKSQTTTKTTYAPCKVIAII